MKEQKITHYFKGCTIKYTKCERTTTPQGYFKDYKYETVKKENVYVITQSGLITIKYLDLADGTEWKQLRTKSLKIYGGEETTFEQITNEVDEWLDLFDYNKNKT